MNYFLKCLTLSLLMNNVYATSRAAATSLLPAINGHLLPSPLRCARHQNKLKSQRLTHSASPRSPPANKLLPSHLLLWAALQWLGHRTDGSSGGKKKSAKGFFWHLCEQVSCWVVILLLLLFHREGVKINAPSGWRGSERSITRRAVVITSIVADCFSFVLWISLISQHNLRRFLTERIFLSGTRLDSTLTERFEQPPSWAAIYSANSCGE